MSGLLFFILIPLVPALITMPIVKRAPVHGAFLAAWASLTFLGFAPAGLLGSGIFFEDSIVAGVLVILVSLNGFVVSVMMLRRLSRLYRGEDLGSSMYLVPHHAAVVVVFFIAELSRGEGFWMTAFCAVACSIGALIVGYDETKLPYHAEHAPERKPLAF